MNVMKEYLRLQDLLQASKICKQTVRRKRLLRETAILGLQIAEELGIDIDIIIRGEE